MNGRPWTAAEDAAVREAARRNAEWGTDRPTGTQPEPAGRLRELAAKLGRTYAAVRKRAERIGAVAHREPEAAPATDRECRQCGAPVRGRGRRLYCSADCAALARGRCLTCGRIAAACQCHTR